MDFTKNTIGLNSFIQDRNNFSLNDQFKIPSGSVGISDNLGNLLGTQRSFRNEFGQTTHIIRNNNGFEQSHTVVNSVHGSSHGGYFVPNTNFMTSPTVQSQPIQGPSYLSDGFLK